MMLKTTCYKKNFANITAEDSFKLLGDEKFFCLVYSPDVCAFSTPEKISDVFEMRCFNENFELRWVMNTKNFGDAVILSERQALQNMELEKIGEFYKRPSSYLLWGTAKKIRDKMNLFEHRIGEIEIPINLEQGERVSLNFDEFFCPGPEHGNMIWKFERLKGLEKCT